MGGIVQTDQRLMDFSVSISYTYFDIIFAIPKGRPYTSFEKLFFPFRIYVWLSLSMCFTIAFILFRYLRHRWLDLRKIIIGFRSQSSTPFFNMVNIFLGGPLARLPITRTALQLFTIWILVTMVLRAAYQGHLFNMLQSKMTNPPDDTIRKILDGDMKIYSTTTFFNILYKNLPNYRHRLTVYDPSPDSLNKLYGDSFSGAFLLSSAAIAAFNQINHMNGTISITKDRLFLLPVSIFFPKGSCLEPSFNEQLNKYISSGLLHNWLKIFIDMKYAREKKRESQESQPEPMSMHQITGILIIMLVINGISVLVFILELLSNKFRMLQKIFERL